MPIRMRESKKQNAICEECGIPFNSTRALIEMQIADKRVTLCKRCEEVLFSKLLAIDCKYNERLKKPVDLQRGYRENTWRKKHE